VSGTTAAAEKEMGVPVLLALTAHTVISSGTHLVTRHAAQLWPPMALLTARALISGVVFVVLLFVVKGPVLPPKGTRLAYLGLGFLAGPLNQGFFVLGMAKTHAVHAGLLYALTPIGVYLLGIALGREKLEARRAIGVVLAFLGVTVLLARRVFGAEGGLVGDLWLSGAMVAWVGWTVESRRFSIAHGGFRTAAWSIIAGVLWMVPLGPLVLSREVIAAVPEPGWVDLAYLVVMTSVVSYALWNFALSRIVASRVAVFANLQPVLTALGAWAFLGEPLGWDVLFAGVFVLAGVRLAQTPAAG
jgi:drug/metabolite transporter (DMT)-like permease